MASGMINCIKEWRCYLKLANSRVVEKVNNVGLQFNSPFNLFENILNKK